MSKTFRPIPAVSLEEEAKIVEFDNPKEKPQYENVCVYRRSRVTIAFDALADKTHEDILSNVDLTLANNQYLCNAGPVEVRIDTVERRKTRIIRG